MLEGVAVVANIFCDAPQTVSCTTDLHIFTFLLGFVVPIRTLLLEFAHQPKKLQAALNITYAYKRTLWTLLPNGSNGGSNGLE